jgi:hypothetical protein
MTSLKSSYDGLVEIDQKHMFVDIACFMLGHSKHVALTGWDSLEEDRRNCVLATLVNKGLVKVNFMGELEMHDLLRDMGRNIVTKMAKEKRVMQSHVWNPVLAAKILQPNQTEKLEILALSLVGVDPSFVTWQADSFARLMKLRYLFLDGCLVNGKFSHWPEDLRWLQWRNCPLSELPSDLKLQNLAVLDLANSPHLTCVWTRHCEQQRLVGELRILNLSECRNLVEVPQDIVLGKLKQLNLRSCYSLNTLPDSMPGYSELEFLNLSYCTSLMTL